MSSSRPASLSTNPSNADTEIDKEPSTRSIIGLSSSEKVPRFSERKNLDGNQGTASKGIGGLFAAASRVAVSRYTGGPWGTSNTARQTHKSRLSYEHMANKVLMSLSLKRQTSAQWSCLRTCLHRSLESTTYSVFVGIVIMMNVLFVIHETDLRASDTGVPNWIIITSYSFLGVFVAEVLVRFFVYRVNFFRSAWNILDFLVVLTDLCVECTKLLLAKDVPSLSVLRIFRLVRILRLVAMLSVFPIFQELQTMLLGFGSATMKAMIWASFMIGIVITVCSIVAVEFIHPLNVEVSRTGVYGDCERCSHAFETVAQSNLTFIQHIIAGDAWGEITMPIIEAYPASSIFFLTVLVLIDLGVLNLILMVIVNAAESAREANQEVLLRGKARLIEEDKKNLKSICQSLDVNEDGRISLEEFKFGIDDNEGLRTTLALLDIQEQDAEVIFNLMDEDGSGDVDFHEFVHTLISTKHDTLNTKLLFMKSSLQQIHKELTSQKQRISTSAVDNMLSSQEFSNAVDKAYEESIAKMDLRGDKIIGECETITRKLEQRWEQLQMEQARSCRMLEKVLDEVSLPTLSNGTFRIRPEERGVPRQSTLSKLSMPQSCSHCTVDGENGSAILMRAPTPEQRPELAEKTERVTDLL